ncbi:Polyketide cyclase / dehydrase and lipid transport [Nocardioides dokdonensis FR1436]|uniref:Polyketide cyclase / dehydrase and lipid transport n=1 Tax=Nocardioides dokdonensis FR1436 TaxID=1300347 RepID=A0A1A9GJE0_9ACTN|nr:SRPBCC family protein [Nocardioides dokdonensis]ANH38447.1 Polyketide cyclase / dehydrase and lipid transport [Nocardioides dokdonensis FR1436]
MSERHLAVRRRMAAPPSAVWAVYADFPHLATHWSGLRSSSAIGDQSDGVGARRRVGLRPLGSMDEIVTVWEEGRRIDTENQPSLTVPIRHARSSLTLEPDGDGTVATFDYRYRPRGGPLGGLLGPVTDKLLTATFTHMLEAGEHAARAGS